MILKLGFLAWNCIERGQVSQTSKFKTVSCKYFTNIVKKVNAKVVQKLILSAEFEKQIPLNLKVK